MEAWTDFLGFLLEMLCSLSSEGGEKGEGWWGRSALWRLRSKFKTLNGRREKQTSRTVLESTVGLPRKASAHCRKKYGGSRAEAEKELLSRAT